ncbi:BON domain-containing protein [Nesterenkonia aurantiaca]|uniref:BON domain-containing protein n=1 Tax=Nesterenkonia aurantiaca TaxID=1436010 RepID=UPI003EE7E20F
MSRTLSPPASRVFVTRVQSTAVLRGFVKSRDERKKAGLAVAASPAVTHVDNRLKIRRR